MKAKKWSVIQQSPEIEEYLTGQRAKGNQLQLKYIMNNTNRNAIPNSGIARMQTSPVMHTYVWKRWILTKKRGCLFVPARTSSLS